MTNKTPDQVTLVVPEDWVKVTYDHCVACGADKSDRNKGKCFAYGTLVNKGRHQYIGLTPPTK